MGKFANLQAFVTVVESGGFSRAARRLDIATSLVSRRVSALESALGVQLLQRTTRSHTLTGAGREFYERATRILAELDEAEQSVGLANADLRGRLRVAAPLSFGLRHLSDALAEFLVDHPAIEIDLDLNDRTVNLVEEGLDMAVRIGELADSTLVTRRLGLSRFATCASREYLARHGTPQTPDALSTHVGLHYNNVPSATAWQFTGSDGQPHTAQPGIRMRANNGDVLAQMAVAGLGIINLPTFIASHLIERGELVTILDDFRRTPIGIHAVFPPGRLISRRARVFADFLAGRFGDRPTWDRLIGRTDD